MEIGSNRWKEVIISGAKDLGIVMDSTSAAHFSLHAAELLKWTQKTNLTTITDPLDIAVRHFLDSVSAVPFIPKGCSILDIGSGGGFPGLPLKVAIPSLKVTLIDGSRKKVSFLQHMIRSLDLNQTEAMHIRAEALGKHLNMFQVFDVIVCRALGNLNAFVKLALPLLASGGKMIAYRGKSIETEIEVDQPFTIHPYRLPYVDSERSLVVVTPI